MKAAVTLTAVILVTFILFAGAKVVRNNISHTQLQEQVFQYPDNVRSIIDSKCFGCHSADAGSQEAKDALMWDDLPELSLARQVATLDGIIEVLEEGTMPPQRMVEMNPDAKLSEEEVEALISWAETTADHLLK